LTLSFEESHCPLLCNLNIVVESV